MSVLKPRTPSVREHREPREAGLARILLSGTDASFTSWTFTRGSMGTTFAQARWWEEKDKDGRTLEDLD